jgi:antitoxin ParD1/3/4
LHVDASAKICDNLAMHISLPQNLASYVTSQMASGLYRDETEVISEALRQKIVSEQTENPTLQALRREIMIGWDEAERGEFVALDLESMKRELDADSHG